MRYLMQEVVFELRTEKQGASRRAQKGEKDKVTPSHWSEETSELLWSDKQSELWTSIKV